MEELLNKTVRDKISGLVGTVTSVVLNKACVVPKSVNGLYNEYWIIIDRLELVNLHITIKEHNGVKEILQGIE